MATALSLGGGGRRRWLCRAARRGNGGAGCRHFHVHVHYHVPRQVWAFSPPRLPPRFMLLPCLLILPVLLLVVLAFLVCFGWLTLVYLASSLWSQSVDHARDANEFGREDERDEERTVKLVIEHAGHCGLSEVCVEGKEIREAEDAGDANEFGKEDEREERPVKLVTEHDGHSGLSEVCVQGKEIREAEDGISEESRSVSRMASTGICINNNEPANDEKIVKEVMMFEPCKAFAELDGSTEKHQLVMDIPTDCFLEELSTKEFSISLNSTTKLPDVLSIGEVFDANRKEISVSSSTEILKFIDKHDSAEILVNHAGTDFVIPEVTSSDDSTTHGLVGDKYMKESKQEQSLTELSVDSVPEKLPEDVTDEWQETQTLVIEHNNKQPEVASNEEYRKQIVGTSDESQDSLCQMVGLPLDSASENISENAIASKTTLHQTNSDKDIELQEELIQNRRVESSTSACDFADSHWRIIEELQGFADEENVHEERTSVLGKVEDEDEDTDNYASMGTPRRLPLVRRSPAPWWSLCGVLDVFAGGED